MSRGLWKYFMMISTIHAATRGAHICFQTIVHYGCSFANGHDVNTLRMSSSYATLCGQTKRVFCVRVCSASTADPCWHWIVPNAIRERRYQVRVSVSVWAVTVGNIVVSSCLLCGRLTAQRCRDFLETVLQGLLEDVPAALRQRYWFLHDGAPVHCGEDVWQWLNATYPGRCIGHGGPFAWPPRSPDLTPMDSYENT
jgi:hypothetical protein